MCAIALVITREGTAQVSFTCVRVCICVYMCLCVSVRVWCVCVIV